jgi:hypothetical protein
MNANAEYRAKYARTLIEKVQSDHYPSTTHMDLIEQTLPDEWVPVYLEVLLEKVADDHNPSISMLKRIAALVERVPAETG